MQTRVNGAPTKEAAKLAPATGEPLLDTNAFLVPGEKNMWPKARTRRRRAEWRAYIQLLKTETPCADCGESFPYYVMEFDHREGRDDGLWSRGLVGMLIAGNASNERIYAEIEKCDIVCANCHCVRTHERRMIEDTCG